jgi:hypothetical protein
MDKLDKIEMSYIKAEGQAKMYDGTIVKCVAYSRPDGAQRGPEYDNPPQERYVDIMIKGAEENGVKQEYIN